MKYELLSAKRMVGKNAYEVEIRATPQTFLEYFKPFGEQKYHVRTNEWYKIPGFQRCSQNLESHLTTLYSHVQRLAEQESTPNLNTP